VPAGQRRVPVVLDTSGGSANLLATELREGVPIPPGAHAAQGSDESLVISQPSTNTLWEFWLAHDVSGTWHARWGGKMSDVSRNPGFYSSATSWGGSGTSLSLLGGLIRIADLRSGQIDHALALAIPHARSSTFVFPAQRSDGNDASPTAIPEGTRFRLNPKLDIDALHLPPVTKMIAIAAQRYGIIVRDQAGSVVFYAEDPSTTTQPRIYEGPRGLFGGLAPSQLLRSFPWSQLEVVRPPSTR
jgi:hypothetical protein